MIPWSSSRLSFSIPELFDDGVDNQRFEEVAKGLLDLIATELSGESEDVSPYPSPADHTLGTLNNARPHHST